MVFIFTPFFVVASEAKQSRYLSGLLRHFIPRNDDSLVGIASLFSQGALRSSQ